MTIRFSCPKCGKSLAVKSDCAGKKGKCTCGAVVAVPAAAEPAAITFSCGICSRVIKVPQAYAGKTGRCPGCRNAVVVPQADARPPLDTKRPAAQRRVLPAGMVRFQCSMCSSPMEAQESSAGNLVECPRCGAFAEVPGKADDGSRSAAAAEGRSDIPSAARAAPATGKVICPSCSRKLADDATVCVACGIYVSSGRPLLTARGIDEDVLHERSHQVVTWLSWLVPVGVYPVYSEVMGEHRPYATWAITALTVLISAWFLAYQYTGSPRMQSMKNLMLWAGDEAPSDELIETLYEYTSYGDTQAFLEKKEELKDTTPEEELDRAALKELSPEQQCFGRYRHTQLLTHAFLHGGPLHLAGNMLFLIIFGSRISAVIGNLWSPILYVLLAIMAALTHLMMSGAHAPTAMLGASGAVMGMAGVYLVLFPIHRVFMTAWWRWGLLAGFHLSFSVFAVRGFWVVLFYIFFDVVALLLPFETTTAHWAHVGGLLWGIAAGLILLVARAAYSRTDVLSLVLGRYAWPLIGSPHKRL